MLAVLAVRHARAQDAAPALSAGSICERAGAEAAAARGIPAGLLTAIGQVESGRRDAQTGRISPWPWTINALGEGHFFSSRQEAVAAVQALRAQGVRSIDAGCFQINLLHHPNAFASIADAFDPVRNAQYGAEFLAELHARLGTWDDAVAAYHSGQEQEGRLYRERVFARWHGAPWIGKAMIRTETVTFAPDSAQDAWGMHIVVPGSRGAAPAVIRIRQAQAAPSPPLPRIVTPRG